MPSRDANGNWVYSQAEYDHFNFTGERFYGFVEGIGYTCTDIVVTPHAINKSKRTIINEINHIQYTFHLNESLNQDKSNNYQIDTIDESTQDNDSFSAEELRLAIEKSQSYSFEQGKLPWVYRTVSRITTDHDNFAVNVIYNIVNDWFQVAQIASLGAFQREEWYNPFTGTRFGNLDGTPSYDPANGVISAVLIGMPMGAKSVGYVIPKGMFHVEDFEWGKGPIGEKLNKLANTLLSMINGQISGGKGITKARGLSTKVKEYEERQRERKKGNNK